MVPWHLPHICTFAASTHLSNTYHSNFAASTLIILFSEMLKFSEYFFERTKFCEGKYGIFRNILFVEMKISNFN